jgi:hypothetical protein
MAVGSISIHLWGDSVVAASVLGASATSKLFGLNVHDGMAVGSISIHPWGVSVVAASVLGGSATSDRDRARRHRTRLRARLRARLRTRLRTRLRARLRARLRPRLRARLRARLRPRARRIMVSVMMMMMMMGRGRLRARARTRTIAVGPECIAGRYAVGTAPEFGSRASTHFLWIVRTRLLAMATSGIRLRLVPPFGRIQTKHVQQNGGDVRHHDEGDEDDEPRKNGESANAQLVQ